MFFANKHTNVNNRSIIHIQALYKPSVNPQLIKIKLDLCSLFIKNSTIIRKNQGSALSLSKKCKQLHLIRPLNKCRKKKMLLKIKIFLSCFFLVILWLSKQKCLIVLSNINRCSEDSYKSSFINSI